MYFIKCNILQNAKYNFYRSFKATFKIIKFKNKLFQKNILTLITQLLCIFCQFDKLERSI